MKSTATAEVAAPVELAEKQIVKVRLGKDHIRRFELPNGDRKIDIYHLYPRLADWRGKEVPDDVNPRSHDLDMIKSGVAREIEQTIETAPSEFVLANRGETIIAESLRFDPDRSLVEITIVDREIHGMADGATTDAVIGIVQRKAAGDRPFQSLVEDEIPDFLKRARLHVEVIVGIDNRDKIGVIARGRNTSRQVKSWSLADFRGAFDWIRDILEKSPVFAGKVGYEENAGKPVTVLDVISLMTLFSREWDEKGPGMKRKAPTVAYSSKGRMDARLQDPKLAPYYIALSPILEDILKLHDQVYAGFSDAYKAAMNGGKLGRRRGVENQPTKLPLTGAEAPYELTNGYVFPLLAAFRALVEYSEDNKAKWKIDPFRFFGSHGPELVGVLIEQVDNLGGNAQLAGKSRAVYTSLHDRAKLLVADEVKA